MDGYVMTCSHYSDTVTRSGMFCAMASVIDRCKTEGVVDVFQAVKALRVQKPGAVPTVVSQYHLLHFQYSIDSLIQIALDHSLCRFLKVSVVQSCVRNSKLKYT